MKGNSVAKIKCPFCAKMIQVKNYTAHTKSKKCKQDQWTPDNSDTKYFSVVNGIIYPKI